MLMAYYSQLLYKDLLQLLLDANIDWEEKGCRGFEGQEDSENL